MQKRVVAVILAAGKGTRMKSAIPKVLHHVCGRYMIEHVVSAARETGVERIITVVGHEAEMIQDALGEQVEYVHQPEQLGTGHALIVTKPVIKSEEEIILVLCGDTPLITSDSLRHLLENHTRTNAAVTILTSIYQEPAGYGRIIRSSHGSVEAIVEEKEASVKEKNVREINTGIYCFSKKELFRALDEIKPNNNQKEYYLTDCIRLIKENGQRIEAVTGSEEETMGVNSRVHLAQAEKALRLRVMEELMIAGVTVVDPNTTYVDCGATVAADTVIYPFTFIEGNSVVDGDCHIGPGTRIIRSRIGSGSVVQNSVVMDSQIGDHCNIGPYAYLRPGTLLEANVKVGDFVEIKKSTIRKGSKIPHLSYIGDSDIGTDVNIGAGTITCNYDGFRKSETVIEDRAFIGSNANLVAPVRVGQGAIVGAGSTITEDIPPEALAIARHPQKNIENWARKKREDMKKLPEAISKDKV